MKLSFKLAGVPPSYNINFKINFRKRQIYLSSEAREFKKMVMINTPPFDIKQGSMYKLTIRIQDNWWCKNGNIRRKDIQNLDKLLIDALFEKFGADDCQVFTTIIDKIPKGGSYDETIKPVTFIELEEIE